MLFSSDLVDLGRVLGSCHVQFSLSVVSNSLQPHELQHARPPYPSPTPGVHSRGRSGGLVFPSLSEFSTSIKSVMPSSHLILCRPLTHKVGREKPKAHHDTSCRVHVCSVVSNSFATKILLCMEFSRQEYQSELHFLCQELPDPGIEPSSLVSPELTGRFFTTVPPESP